MGYLWKKCAIYLQKLWDILVRNFGIYRGKTMGNVRQELWCIMGYSGQNVWVMLSENYGIYWEKLWDILWDILIKNHGIYSAKTIEYIEQKLLDI